MVRSRAALDSIELVHDELGLLGNCAAAQGRAFGRNSRHGSLGRVGSFARSGDEQSYQLLDLGAKRHLLRDALDELARLGRYRVSALRHTLQNCASAV